MGTNTEPLTDINTPEPAPEPNDAPAPQDATPLADTPPVDPAPEPAPEPQDPAPSEDVHTIKIGDADVEVSKEVADHFAELQSQVDAVNESRVPEDGYALNVPEHLAEMVKADMDDPRVSALFETAKSNNWSQETVDAVTSIYYENAAAEAKADQVAHGEEKAKLVKMVDPNGVLGEEKAMEQAQEVTNWAIELLADDIKKNPGIAEEIKFSTTTADGWALLSALKNKTRVGGGPRPADANDAPNPFAKDTFNLTAQGKLMRENPELAKSLKEQAESV